MNSSGIKRGLATTAVSALAIAGLPLFASAPASAAPGDTMTTVFQGPALNGGGDGAYVVLEVNEGSFGVLADGADVSGELALTSTTGTMGDAQNNGDQNLSIASAEYYNDNGANQQFGDNDGKDEIVVRIDVIADPGTTATARIFRDDVNTNGNLDAGEARSALSIAVAGPATRVVVTPASQTVPENVQSGDYTVTLKDAAGRTTQLESGDSLAITEDGTGVGTVYDEDGVVVTSLDDTQLAAGTTTVTASADDVDVYNFLLESVADPTVEGKFILDVTEAATLGEEDVNIVTGADDWFSPTNNNGFGTETYLAPTERSVDFVIDAGVAEANTTVTLTFDSADVTFGGKDTITKSIVLDSQGKGAINLAVDSGTVQEGDEIDVSGSFALQLEYDLAYAAGFANEADAYTTAFKGATTVTTTVVDQYGNPISSGQVGVDVDSGPNSDGGSKFPDQRKNVGPDGTVSFTITDTKATAGTADNVYFYYYPSEFTADGNPDFSSNLVEIRYSEDGLGSDFTIRLDGETASGAGYNPANNVIAPLTDAVADNAGPANFDERMPLEIVNLEPDTSVTVTVDNGAKLIPFASVTDTLAEGVSSVTGDVDDIDGEYYIVGTKTGLVTVTVTNAGRTESSQFTVAQDANEEDTARNLSLSGPAKAASGSTATFTAIITDAFGNPVQGFERQDLNVTVTGPAAFQDGSAESNANGEIALNVRLFENADAPITVSVSARDAQFGADANRLNDNSIINDAPGLTESVDSATATVSDVTNLEVLRQAVKDAEAALAAANVDLANAQANLDVALTEVAVQQSEVQRLKERKAELRQKLNKAKDADNKKKAKTTRKKLRNVKQQLNDAKDALVVAQTSADAAQDVVDAAQVAVTAAEEALAKAKQDLEDAQN